MNVSCAFRGENFGAESYSLGGGDGSAGAATGFVLSAPEEEKGVLMMMVLAMIQEQDQSMMTMMV